MSPMSPKQQAELRTLMAESVSGPLSQADQDRLVDLVRQGPEARRLYLDTLELYVDLHDLTHSHETFILEDPQTVSDSNRRRLLGPAWLSLAALLLVLLGLAWTRVHLGPQVATLVDAMDLNTGWGVPSQSGRRLRSTRGYLHLRRGWAQLYTDYGVDVVIEAPAAFKLGRDNRLCLKQGRVYAKVADEAHGFTLVTPEATIIDLGTEFGVTCSRQQGTEVHVTAGQVDVHAGSQPVESLLEGHALGIRASGEPVRGIPFDDQTFVRALSSRQGLLLQGGDSLDLADIVAGGNGLGTGPAHMEIDPLSGEVRPMATAFRDRQGDGRYHAVPSSDYVDGVFVPEGRQSVQVTSDGKIWADCPETCNIFFSEILGGSTRLKGRVDGQERGMMLAYREYGTADRPGLFMHANLGITFDLQALRRDYGEHLQVTRLQARVGLSEETNRAAYGDADVIVLLDGRVVWQKTDLRVGRVLDLDVPIPEHARFLTLAVTDSGANGSPYVDTFGDWCVWGEPKLVIE